MSIDWSNRDGTSFVTGPRNQGQTTFCFGFAATALVESMVRIEHGAWCVRSEGDLFTGLGYYDFLGGNEGVVSPFFEKHGLADPDCLPWSGLQFNYTFPHSCSSDRVGRTVKVPALKEISGVAAQKTWLDTVGPLIATIDVFADFQVFYQSGAGVYQQTGNFPGQGQHVILIIGYDDGINNRCWIAKNSWGTTPAHPQAIFRIGYGEVNIDRYAKFGLQGTNPDPATKRRHHGGGLLVSGNGPLHRNLEFFLLWLQAMCVTGSRNPECRGRGWASSGWGTHSSIVRLLRKCAPRKLPSIGTSR
jgi:hypothetical protein